MLRREKAVSSHPPADVTQILMDWSGGDAAAPEKLMPLGYEELRRLAGKFCARLSAQERGGGIEVLRRSRRQGDFGSPASFREDCFARLEFRQALALSRPHPKCSLSAPSASPKSLSERSKSKSAGGGRC